MDALRVRAYSEGLEAHKTIPHTGFSNISTLDVRKGNRESKVVRTPRDVLTRGDHRLHNGKDWAFVFPTFQAQGDLSLQGLPPTTSKEAGRELVWSAERVLDAGRQENRLSALRETCLLVGTIGCPLSAKLAYS